MDLKVAVAGAGGQMGAAIIRAVVATPGLSVHSAFDRPGKPAVGLDAGTAAGIGALDLTIGDDPETALAGADALIDFTAPAASVLLAQYAARTGMVDIVGTTGCTEEDDEAIYAAAAAGARIVKAGNFSLGVNLLRGLVKRAAAVLGDDFDIEILEMHHREKVDAPSGTALLLGNAVASGRGDSLADDSVAGRAGLTGRRVEGTIGFASLRGGTVAGDHQVIFAGDGERIELGHRAESREIFARGAIRGALWLIDRPAGRYTMAEVLGL